MKCGRLTATDVHDFGETLSTALNKRPESSCAIVVAPHLTSEKVLHGHRGELRPIIMKTFLEKTICQTIIFKKILFKEQ